MHETLLTCHDIEHVESQSNLPRQFSACTKVLEMRNRFAGGCHCASIKLVFETNHSLQALPLRSCACSFCIKHGTRCTSDPNGILRILVLRKRTLSCYDSDKTHRRIICRKCGAYLGMLIRTAGRYYGTANVNSFERSGEFVMPSQKMDYGRETEKQRLERRKSKWTPALLTFQG